MRLSRSDAKQNGRATSICKAYAKRASALQAASDQCFIGGCKNVRLRKHPKNGILLLGFGTYRAAMSISTDRPEREAEPVSDSRFDHADEGHFEAGSPPGAEGYKGFDGADGEMSYYTYHKCSNNGGQSGHEKERNDRNERSHRGGERR